jgi:glutamate-1-semialdehyde aminotransferase
LCAADAGFLDGLRRVTERHGALLIIDEVMTASPRLGRVQVPMNLRRI